MFTQFTQSRSVQYEIPSRRYDIYGYPRRTDAADVAAVVVSLFFVLVVIVGLMVWAWSVWRLATKAGYKGMSRFFWFLFLTFPLTSGFSWFAFLLVTWPVQKELDKSQAQLDELRRLHKKPNYSTEIDDELEQLRRQLPH